MQNESAYQVKLIGTKLLPSKHLSVRGLHTLSLKRHPENKTEGENKMPLSRDKSFTYMAKVEQFRERKGIKLLISLFFLSARIRSMQTLRHNVDSIIFAAKPCANDLQRRYVELI